LLISTGQALAGVTCVVESPQLRIFESAPAPDARSCSYSCLVLRKGEPVEVSCKVAVKAGTVGECTAKAEPEDAVVGAAAACGDDQLPKFNGPATGAPK